MGAEARSLYVTLSANVTGFTGRIGAAGAAVRGLGNEVVSMSDRSNAALQATGRVGGRFALGLGAALGLSAKAAMDWESQWAGVLKTVDGSDAQLSQLEDDLRSMAKTMPATHQEIAATAEAAGQLGVAVEDVAEFTRVMVMMGETTNITSEDAATKIAQFMNVMKTAGSEVDEIGNTIVALGNKGASTESQIVDMAQRLAGAGKLVGASEADVLGLASAMANLGIQAQLGGGVVQRVFIGIESQVKSGGDKLSQYAELAGTSAEEFARAWGEDPVAAFDMLLQGLGKVAASGGDVTSVLGDMGIKGTENLQVMLRLAGAGDMLTKSLDQSRTAWEENSALTDEYRKRAETTASQVKVAWNRIKDSAIDAGGAMLPMIADLANMVGDLGAAFSDLPGPAQDALTVMLAMAAVIGGGAWFGAKVVGGIRATKANLGVLRGEMSRVNASMGVGGVSGPRAFARDLGIMASTASTAGARTTRELQRVAAARARVMGSLKTFGKGAALAGGLAVMGSGIADDFSAASTASMGLMGAMIGGPAGAVAGGLVGAFLDVKKSGQEARDTVAAVEAAFSSSESTISDWGSAAEDAMKGFLAAQADSGSTTGFNDMLGDAMSGWDQVLSGGTSNTDRFAEASRMANDELVGMNGTLQTINDALGGDPFGIGKIVDADGNIQNVNYSLQDMDRVVTSIAPAMDDLGLTLMDLKADPEGTIEKIVTHMREMGTSGAAVENLAGAFDDLGGQIMSVEERAKMLDDALTGLLGASLNQSASADQWNAGLRDMAANLAEGSRQLNGNSAAAMQNRDVIRSRIGELQQMLTAEAAAGAGPKKLAKMLQVQRSALIDSGVAAGMSRQKLRAYVNQMGLTPKAVKTVFKTLGLDKAKIDARQLKERYNALPRNVRVHISQKGAPKTGAEVEKLQRKFKLTDREIQTIISARDDATVKIDKVKARVKDTDKDEAEVTIDAKDLASRVISAVNGRLTLLDGNTATVTITTRQVTERITRNRTEEASGPADNPGKSTLDRKAAPKKRYEAPTGRAPAQPRTTKSSGLGRVNTGRMTRVAQAPPTVIVREKLPSKMDLVVDGARFTAYVRGEAGKVSREVSGSVRDSQESSGRMNW